MAIKHRYSGDTYTGTLAEFMAETRIYKQGSLLIPSDSAQVRIADGKHVFSVLTSFASGSSAAKVVAIGAPAAFTAIGAVFADLAASRTAVNTLRTETLASDTATNAKLDAVIAALKTAGLMLSV